MKSFVHKISDALSLRKQMYILSRYRERRTIGSFAREAHGLHLPMCFFSHSPTNGGRVFTHGGVCPVACATGHTVCPVASF
jgi:hypothetical protein